MISRICCVYGASLVLALAAIEAGAQAPRDYATDLATLYGERHWVVALKDACSRVLPSLRRDTQAAYEEWLSRHEDLLEDLETRFAAMVKQASRDQKEYTRNYGKYQGEVMQQRQEQKEAFLALPKEELIKQCKELPGYLRSSKSDIPNKYPEEFQRIYRKKP